MKRGRYTTGHFIFRLIILTTLFSAHPVLAQTALEKTIVGYSAQAGAYAPIWITKEAGLFRKNGLDVNLVFIPGGPTAAAAMIATKCKRWRWPDRRSSAAILPVRIW